MDSTRQMAIVEAVKAAAKQDFGGIEGNPWEPNPPELQHFEMMMFVRVDLPLAAEERLGWGLSPDEKEFLGDRALRLVTTSRYYAELMGEVDTYQAECNRPAADRVASLKRRGASR